MGRGKSTREQMASADPEPAYPRAGPSTAAFFADTLSDDESEATDLLRGSGPPTYTPEEEAAVVKKFDRKLVLFVALLYMFSFLDRSSACHVPRVSNFLPCLTPPPSPTTRAPSPLLPPNTHIPNNLQLP